MLRVKGDEQTCPRGQALISVDPASYAGMAYRFTDISVKPIYRHVLKYRLSVSVKVRTDKISAIGYRLWPNIGSKYRLYFGDFPPIYR